MTTTSVHQGPCASIHSEASPGLVWLKSFLPIIDSLNVHDHKDLGKYLDASATFTINNGDPVAAEKIVSMLAMRSTGLSKFGHEVHTAWDVAGDDGGRTVFYESTSTTVFKADEAAQEISVKEFNVIELVKGGDGGLKATALRTYMDPSPVSARAAALKAKKET